MNSTIHLKSDFELPAKHCRYRKDAGNMTIITESVSMGKARQLCADLKLALEYGAFPAAHALLIEKIGEANREGKPLACSMEFTP